MGRFGLDEDCETLHLGFKLVWIQSASDTSSVTLGGLRKRIPPNPSTILAMCKIVSSLALGVFKWSLDPCPHTSISYVMESTPLGG